MDARSYTRDMIEHGGRKAPVSEIGGEVFTFNSWAEFQTFKAANPALFDGSPEDRRAAWVKFGQTSAGKAIRTR